MKRNEIRFPEDFRFRLKKDEYTNLKCQIGISSENEYGGRRTLPYVFTEQGIQITEEEYISLRSQIVTSKDGRGGRRYLPYVFTEQGIAMLSAVLLNDEGVIHDILKRLDIETEENED